jgi:hypothetical protein
MEKNLPPSNRKFPTKRIIKIIFIVLIIILLASIVSYFTAKYYTARVNVTTSLEENTGTTTETNTSNQKNN